MHCFPAAIMLVMILSACALSAEPRAPLQFTGPLESGVQQIQHQVRQSLSFDAGPELEPRTALDFALRELPARAHRLVMLTSEKNPVCWLETPHLKGLAARGWEVGPADTDQIQVLDMDNPDDRATMQRLGLSVPQVLPRFVLIHDARIVSTAEGFKNAFAIGDLYTAGLK